MKVNKLTVTINKSARNIFDFVLDPLYTPTWIDSVAYEEKNENTTKLGTIYKNKDSRGNWSVFKITAFKQDKMFVMSKKDSNYHVRYTLKPLSEGSCELEYFEWVEDGELEEPFTRDVLNRLKKVNEEG